MGDATDEMGRPSLLYPNGEVADVSPLRNLYYLLSQLSSGISRHHDGVGDMFSLNVSNAWLAAKIKFTDISVLSDTLFKELDAWFTRLMRGSSCDPRMMSTASEHLVLLLRCCLVMLHLLEFDLTSVLEKCQVLMKILRELLSVDSARQKISYGSRNELKEETVAGIPSESGRSLDSLSLSSEEFNSVIHFKCTALEAFADELLMRHNLRKHFEVIDTILDVPQKLFTPASNYVDIYAIMDIISAHFILSVNDEKGFNQMHQSLFWSHETNYGISEISLNSIIALLRTSVIFSVPQILQTHIFLVASRCITSPDDGTDVTLLNNYISAFEISGHFYGSILSRLQLGGDDIDMECQSEFNTKCMPKNNLCLSLHSAVRPATFNKVDHHMFKLSNFHKRYLHCMIFESDTQKINTTMAYVEENIHLMEEPYRETTSIFIKFLITASIFRNTENKEFSKIKDGNWQDIYRISAVLKLMSSSLLHIVRALKKTQKSNEKVLNEYLSGKEYDHVLQIISSLVGNRRNSLIAKVSCYLQESCSVSCVETKLMLVHLADLLHYGLDFGIEYLWKGSIFMIIVLLNLLIFEEGNLNWLRLCHTELVPLSFPQKFQGVACRRSSYIIASNVQKIQNLYLKEMPACLTYGSKEFAFDASKKIEDRPLEKSLSIVIAENQEDTELALEGNRCNGESFLGPLGCNQTDIDDLANFIDCTPGKDYESWLKNRENFRKWTAKKSAAGRRKRGMNHTWKGLVGRQKRKQPF